MVGAICSFVMFTHVTAAKYCRSKLGNDHSGNRPNSATGRPSLRPGYTCGLVGRGDCVRRSSLRRRCPPHMPHTRRLRSSLLSPPPATPRPLSLHTATRRRAFPPHTCSARPPPRRPAHARAGAVVLATTWPSLRPFDTIAPAWAGGVAQSRCGAASPTHAPTPLPPLAPCARPPALRRRMGASRRAAAVGGAG